MTLASFSSSLSFCLLTLRCLSRRSEWNEMTADGKAMRQALVAPRRGCHWVAPEDRRLSECLCSGLGPTEPQGVRGLGERFLKDPGSVCCVCISEANKALSRKWGLYGIACHVIPTPPPRHCHPFPRGYDLLKLGLDQGCCPSKRVGNCGCCFTGTHRPSQRPLASSKAGMGVTG